MKRTPGLSFAVKHLDPGSRMLEILFGLIMTLTFTLGAGMTLQQEGAEGARHLLIATAGCNLAWGVIDGIFYVLGQLFERGRRLRIAAGVRAAASEVAARSLVAEEFDESLAPVTDMVVRDGLYGVITRRLRELEIPPVRVRREDLMGGLASGWLVFICTVPAALPFAFIDEPHFALRVSNVLLLGLLFFVGYQAGKRAFARPWLIGTTFLLVGVGLVVGTMALGG